MPVIANGVVTDVVFGARRLLRNDGGPDGIALNKGDGQQQPAFA